MCGIAGFFGNNFADREIILKKMTDIIAHRGPDDEGHYFDQKAALGFRRLAIIDLVTGHQPMSNENESIWIVFNGEIYNYKEIRLLLERKGHRFHTSSDTEVIIHSYEEWGLECLQHFNGMFAFALWDKNNNRSFIARDRLGVKPLYFAQRGEHLVFASEIKSLLQFPGINREVDLQALDAYMSFLWVPEPHTLFKDIYKLESGHYLIYQNNTITTKPYWKLDCDVEVEKNESYWIEKIRTSLKFSVEKRLISDVPLGAFLSGGIDSTSIVALMNQINGNAISTYTIGFDKNDLKNDVVQSDLEYSRYAAKFLNVNYHEIIVNPNVVELLPKLIWHMDEPIADPAAITTYLVCKASRETLTVLLSGVGGDEVFGGYPRFAAMKLSTIYNLIPSTIRNGLIEKIIRFLPASKSPTFRNAKKFIRSANLPTIDRYMGYRTYFNDSEKKNLYTENLKKELQIVSSDPFKEHMAFFNQVKPFDLLSQIMYVDLKTFLPCLNLMYTDKMSMAASVEVREPFLDYELVETFFKMPSHLKLKGLTRKYALKKAMEGLVPSEIIWRKKAGFGAPIRSWITGNLKEMIFDLISEKSLKKRGYFNHAFYKKMIDDEFSGKEYYSNQIWQLLTLELWHKEFIDNKN